MLNVGVSRSVCPPQRNWTHLTVSVSHRVGLRSVDYVSL